MYLNSTFRQCSLNDGLHIYLLSWPSHSKRRCKHHSTHILRLWAAFNIIIHRTLLRLDIHLIFRHDALCWFAMLYIPQICLAAQVVIFTTLLALYRSLYTLRISHYTSSYIIDPILYCKLTMVVTVEEPGVSSTLRQTSSARLLRNISKDTVWVQRLVADDESCAFVSVVVALLEQTPNQGCPEDT